jgi:hypothetical protein
MQLIYIACYKYFIMKKLEAPFSIESLVKKAILESGINKQLFKKFSDNSITKALENKLKPTSENDTFTWEQINDALIS